MSDQSSQDKGGQGGILATSDGHHNRSDMMLLLRAVKDGWLTDPAEKAYIPEELSRVIRDPAVGIRERLRAMELYKGLDDSNFNKLLEYVKRTPDGAEKHEHSFVVYKGIDQEAI